MKKRTKLFNDAKAKKHRNIHAKTGTGYGVKRKFKRRKGR